MQTYSLYCFFWPPISLGFCLNCGDDKDLSFRMGWFLNCLKKSVLLRTLLSNRNVSPFVIPLFYPVYTKDTSWYPPDEPLQRSNRPKLMDSRGALAAEMPKYKNLLLALHIHSIGWWHRSAYFRRMIQQQQQQTHIKTFVCAPLLGSHLYSVTKRTRFGELHSPSGVTLTSSSNSNSHHSQTQLTALTGQVERQCK